MRLAYGDLIGGISGDMFAAALLDLGLPLALLDRELKKIPSLRFELKASKKTVHAIRASRFHVAAPDERKEKPRSWSLIRKLIERSKLASEIQETGIKIFSRLAEAESKIHRVPVADVVFHEVGATDSIVDVMVAAIGRHHLKIDAFHFSTVPLGRGVVPSRHGFLPVPGPATLELLKRTPVQWMPWEGETVTPTGAAILSALGTRFGAMTGMTIDRIGYGAGSKQWPDRPDLFRLVLGRADAGWSGETMLVMETNIDDMNPEFYDYVFERLFAAGARDVFLTPIQMKKNRPATLLRIIAEPSRRDRLAEILFRETSTLGIRYHEMARIVLGRSTGKVKTKYGSVRVKIVEGPDGAVRSTPEYDDVKRLAKERNVPLKVIYDAAAKESKR